MQNIFSKKSFFSQAQKSWESIKTIIDPELEDTFNVVQCQQNRYQRAELKLAGHILILNDKQQLDISNFLIGKVQHKHFGEGIRLQSCEISFEFFGNVDQWYEIMIRYCTQINFIQKFQVLKLIGAGTYGKVYRVKNKCDQKIYAVKTFEKQLCSALDDQEGLVKEINILRKLNHPGIIKLHEVFESEQFVFLVFDLLENTNMLQEDGISMPEYQVFRIIKNILQTLLYLYENNIIHRDLKPENIIMKNQIEFVLIDFGLADYYNEAGVYLYKKCGTPGYCAPEILCNQNYDHKVDIFSLGVICFQMLSGINPFYSKNYQDKLRLNREATPDYGKMQISSDALDLLQGMLQRNPNKRLNVKQALNHKYFTQKRYAIQNKLNQIKSQSSFSQVSETLLNTGSQLSTSRLENHFNFFELGSNSSRYTSPRLSPLRNPIDELDKQILNHEHTYSCHVQKYK